MTLDEVLRELDAEEPKVIVDTDIGAFCMMHVRRAPQVRPTGRLPLEAILAYIANPF